MNELPYWPSSSGNGSVGTYTRNGYGRLYVRETAIDEEQNTSTISITYQAYLAYPSSGFTRGGYISLDGDEKACSGSRSLTTTNKWVDVQTWTWENIEHDADGSKTVTITTRGGYGGGPSLYVYQSSQRRANAVGVGTFTFELTKFERKTGTPVYIGGEKYDAYIGTFGMIDSAKALLHIDGDLTDEFGKTTATGNGAFNSNEKKFGVGSYYLNGSSYLDIPVPVKAENYTIECWFNCTQANASAKYPALFSTNTTSSGSVGGTYMLIDDGSTSKNPSCRVNAKKATSNTSVYGTSAITRNIWHHFAYCKDGASHYFFIDGTRQATVTQANPNDITNVYFGGLMYPSGPSSACYMTGYVDEILITTGCKWTANFTVPSNAYNEDDFFELAWKGYDPVIS